MKTKQIFYTAVGMIALLAGCSSSKPVMVSGVKPCPDWSSDPVSNYSNEGFSNFGCASDANLLTQVKDPADLVHGKGSTEISATRDSAILQGYFSGASPASSSSSTTTSSR